MNRRGLVSGLFAVSATAAIDPERLLWIPKAKTISIPKIRPSLWSGPDGTTIFPAYSADGGIANGVIYYLKHPDNVIEGVRVVGYENISKLAAQLEYAYGPV